jgi:hypothetical protein
MHNKENPVTQQQASLRRGRALDQAARVGAGRLRLRSVNWKPAIPEVAGTIWSGRGGAGRRYFNCRLLYHSCTSDRTG